MAGDPRELLRVTVASRTAGDGDAARAAYVRAYDAARSAGDVEMTTEAAVGLAACQLFGTVPGRVPAFLHEAYRRASGVGRARVTVALAGAWVYGADPARAVSFAEEAVAIAQDAGDAVPLADARDAQLLVHWGPDDLTERVRLARRLADTVSYLTDAEARMTAHLWRLTTALECSDLPATQRQLRVLDALAEESDASRVRFFAAARRGMYMLLTGDAAALAAEAALHEEFGTREGIPLISAMGAVLWLAAGETGRADALLHQLAAGSLAGIPRDVYWLVTVTALTEVAAATGALRLAGEGADLLARYAGQGVVDAGGVLFLGVVDDYLHRALLALGRTEEAEARRRAAVEAYRRMGASWWLRRVSTTSAPARGVDLVHLHPDGPGLWVVRREGSTHAVPDLKGLEYLRLLLARSALDVPALDLSDAVAGHAGLRAADGNAGPLVDRRALSAYRNRLSQLDEELGEADRSGDAGRGQRLADEREALLAQVAAATGLGGRPRAVGATTERARIAVRKAIAGPLARLSDVDPSLGRLLADTVSTGTVCRYDPDPGRPLAGSSPSGPPGRPAPEGAPDSSVGSCCRPCFVSRRPRLRPPLPPPRT